MKGALILLAAMGLGASAPGVEVTLTPLEATVGDPIEMVITARPGDADSDSDPLFSEWGETLGTAEILAIGPVETLEEDGQAIAYQQHLTLAFFETGEMKLPPIDTRFGEAGEQSVVTTPLPTVNVVSVLPEDAEQAEPKPPAPLRPLGLGDRFWWVAAALLLTCVAAFVALRFLAGDPESRDSRIEIAPMDEFRQALKTLRSEREVIALHAGLSLAMRRFLGRTLGFTAPESTTTEIKRELRQRQMPVELVRQTGDLLNSCDLVKFARREAGPGAVEGRIDGAQSIAEGVSALLSTPPADEAAEVQAS
jgi:hypothetical protein